MLALHRLPDPPGFIFRVQLGGVVRRLMCVEACARTCMHTHACMHTRTALTYAHTHARVPACIRMRADTQAHRHTQIGTHTHTHTHKRACMYRPITSDLRVHPWHTPCMGRFNVDTYTHRERERLIG